MIPRAVQAVSEARTKVDDLIDEAREKQAKLTEAAVVGVSVMYAEEIVSLIVAKIQLEEIIELLGGKV